MRSRFYFWISLLPVILLALPAGFIIFGSLHTLRLQSRESLSFQSEYLDVIMAVSSVNEQIIGNHQKIRQALYGALEREMSAIELYRMHSEIVDNLSEIQSQLSDLSASDVRRSRFQAYNESWCSA